MKSLAIQMGLSLALIAGFAPAFADEYPNRPIRLLVGYGAAGAGDNTSRIVAEALSKRLGQPVVVENRPGAGATIASAQLVQAAPDGYTLGVLTASIYGVDQHIYRVRYTGADFTPIAKLASYPLILGVSRKMGVSTLKEFIEKVKEKPGAYNYSTSGTGGSPHVAALMFEKATGASAVHIPFKGGAAALQAVVANEVQFSFGTAPSVLPMSRNDLVTALGVTSLQRSELAPELPTLAESGLPDFDLSYWFGLFGPAQLPGAVTEKLAAAIGDVLNDPAVRARLLSAGLEAASKTSAKEFGEFAARDGKMAGDRVVELGLKPN